MEAAHLATMRRTTGCGNGVCVTGSLRVRVLAGAGAAPARGASGASKLDGTRACRGKLTQFSRRWNGAHALGGDLSPGAPSTHDDENERDEQHGSRQECQQRPHQESRPAEFVHDENVQAHTVPVRRRRMGRLSNA